MSYMCEFGWSTIRPRACFSSFLCLLYSRQKTLNDKVWWKNCLCIDRPYDPAKGDASSAGGDSGAVIFEIEKNKSLLGFGIIFAQQCHSYGSCAVASPLLPALQTLSREIPMNESLSLCSNVVGIPSDADTGELPWGCNIV